MTGSDRGMEFGQPPGGWGPPPGAPPGGGGPPPGAPPGGWGPPPGGAPPGGWGPPPGGAPPGGWGPPPGAPPGGGPPGGGGWGPPPGGAPPGAPPGGGGWGPPPGGSPPGGPPNPWGSSPGYGPPGQYPGGGGYPGGPAGARPGGPGSPFTPGDAISFAWERIKTDPGTILATMIVGFVLIVTIQFITNFASSLVVGALGGFATAGARHGTGVTSLLGPLYWLQVSFGSLLNIFVSSFFVAGMYRFALKVARGEPYSFNELFSGAPLFLSVLVANLAVAVGVMIGFALLIVPGVILALGLSMTVPIIVDRGIGPIEALTASWKLTDGHKGNLFVFGLLVFGLAVAGACACFVGLFLVLPLVYIAQMYIYLKLSGQQVARVAPAV